MSSRKRRRLALSPEAKDDFEDILIYSLRSWGVEQKDVSKAALNQAMQSLREFPKIGRARETSSPAAASIASSSTTSPIGSTRLRSRSFGSFM